MNKDIEQLKSDLKESQDKIKKMEPLIEELKTKISMLEDLLRFHRHTGYDNTSKL